MTSKTNSIADKRWALVVARDKRLDGRFVYSVSTTGVYCRPSCSSRLARRENVAFHDSCEAAEAAGFRPCKRCRPNDVGDITRIRFAIGECSLGYILVGASDKGVCVILLGDDPKSLSKDLQQRFRGAELVNGDRGFKGTLAKAIALVDRPRGAVDLSLDVRGTAFQKKVWSALRQIGVGQTASYAEIAARVGKPRAVRAVARACAANPIAVAIPCHRVVRTGGGLSGYRWGIERKRELLARERVGICSVSAFA